MSRHFTIDENEYSDPSWIFVYCDEPDWDEPDGLFDLMERIITDIGGRIHPVENEYYQYTIDGVDSLIFQWDGCFGIVVICDPNKRKSAIEFLKKYT